jgi:hypothetical protein
LCHLVLFYYFLKIHLIFDASASDLDEAAAAAAAGGETTCSTVRGQG